MDKTLVINSSTESKPKSCSRFPGCLGSSNKKLSKDMKSGASASKNLKTTFLSSFCVNKSTVDTHHVDTAMSEKPNRSTKEFTDYSPKSDKKISPQKISKIAAGINKTYFPAAGPGLTNSEAHNHKKKNSDIDKDVTGKSSKFHQSILLVKEDKRQNPKKENKRTRSSSLISPLEVEISNVVSTKTTRVLPHSISLPPPNRKKEKTIHREDDIDGTVKEAQGELDPIVGMSIMIGTLAIMLVWGKVCAILCTCAWLYMIPRLRTVVNSKYNTGNGLNSGGLDMESTEYKKKVVLEGLLHRDHRRVIGNL